jgi:hypothetical protein
VQVIWVLYVKVEVTNWGRKAGDGSFGETWFERHNFIKTED